MNTEAAKKAATVSSYAMASIKTDEHYTANAKGYTAPTYVEKLPPKVNLNTGVIETVDEVKKSENSEYYDGTTKLKMGTTTSTTSCSSFTNSKTECLKKETCGWCGSSNSCIAGNSLGPQATCQKNTFIYSGAKNQVNESKTSDKTVSFSSS